MKYNTISITNITGNDFTGAYSGIEIELTVGQTRHLPADVSKHIGQQLAALIFKNQDRRNPKTVKGMPQILNEILSKEILTKKEFPILTLKEEITEHERQFAEYLEQKRKEEILKREEALL